MLLLLCSVQLNDNLDLLAGNLPRTDFSRLGQAFWEIMSRFELMPGHSSLEA